MLIQLVYYRYRSRTGTYPVSRNIVSSILLPQAGSGREESITITGLETDVKNAKDAILKERWNNSYSPPSLEILEFQSPSYFLGPDPQSGSGRG